jgi:hypothetical protein
MLTAVVSRRATYNNDDRVAASTTLSSAKVHTPPFTSPHLPPP